MWILCSALSPHWRLDLYSPPTVAMCAVTQPRGGPSRNIQYDKMTSEGLSDLVTAGRIMRICPRLPACVKRPSRIRARTVTWQLSQDTLVIDIGFVPYGSCNCSSTCTMQGAAVGCSNGRAGLPYLVCLAAGLAGAAAKAFAARGAAATDPGTGTASQSRVHISPLA